MGCRCTYRSLRPIDIDPEACCACVFALFALFASCSTNTVLRFDPKAHLLVVRAAFLSMLADGDGDGDCLLLLLSSMLGPVFQKRPVRMFQIANLGEDAYTRSFFRRKRAGFPFF